MKIFTGKDITPPSSSSVNDVAKSRTDNLSTNRETVTRPSQQVAQTLSTLLLYAVVGGCAGFAIRGVLHMIGYKDWMFSYHQSFIAFGNVLNVFNDRWGHLALTMAAFLGLVYGLFKAVSKYQSGRVRG